MSNEPASRSQAQHIDFLHLSKLRPFAAHNQRTFVHVLSSPYIDLRGDGQIVSYRANPKTFNLQLQRQRCNRLERFF
jgi:hypothetical protein